MKAVSIVLVVAALLALPRLSRGQVVVSGSVTAMGTGAPLQGVRVELREAEGGPQVQTPLAWTESDGRYEIRDAAPGMWVIEAKLYEGVGEYTLRTPPILIGGEAIIFDLEFSLPQSRPPTGGMRVIAKSPRNDGSTVFGGTVVNGASGATVPGANLQLIEVPGHLDGTRRVARDSTTSDDEGRFLFAGRPAGRYSIRASAPGFYPVTSEPQKLEGTVGVVLRLPPEENPDTSPPNGGGRIFDGSGRALEGITTSRRRLTEGLLIGRLARGPEPAPAATIRLLDESQQEVRSGNEGFFLFENVRPGTCSLRITWNGTVTRVEGVQVKPGANVISIEL